MNARTSKLLRKMSHMKGTSPLKHLKREWNHLSHQQRGDARNYFQGLIDKKMLTPKAS